MDIKGAVIARFGGATPVGSLKHLKPETPNRYIFGPEPQARIAELEKKFAEVSKKDDQAK